MAKEFNLPPVIFPSGGTPSISTNQRRQPHPPSRPASNPSIPFVAFDIGSAASSGLPNGRLPVRVNADFEDEPTLMEELGINTRQIWHKIVSILIPFKLNPHIHEDADLSGPFVLMMAFGLFQLLAGKIHFGILLGWITVAAIWLYVVFNMLAGKNGNLDVYKCLSLIGYCMLSVVILSALALFVPRGGAVVVCTRLMVELGSCSVEHRGLAGYACLLIYALFSLLVIF
uniref:Protein YIP n=1 Tax=Kalanchoe fedtschenkoi TaxID=63787 RepID=A0A7N0V9A6_KALFE